MKDLRAHLISTWQSVLNRTQAMMRYAIVGRSLYHIATLPYSPIYFTNYHPHAIRPIDIYGHLGCPSQAKNNEHDGSCIWFPSSKISLWLTPHSKQYSCLHVAFDVITSLILCPAIATLGTKANICVDPFRGHFVDLRSFSKFLAKHVARVVFMPVCQTTDARVSVAVSTSLFDFISHVSQREQKAKKM